MNRIETCADCWKGYKNKEIPYSDLVAAKFYYYITTVKNGLKVSYRHLCERHRANYQLLDVENLNTFKNWKAVPENFKTRTQLEQLGLRVVELPVGKLYWNLMHNWMLLYDR